jgi:hypothetical protein
MKSKFRVIIKLFGLAAIVMLGMVSIIASNDGGSGHGGDNTPPPDTTAAAGLWHGTLTNDGTIIEAFIGQPVNNSSFMGITSTDGQFRFIIDEWPCMGTQFEGTFSMDGNTGSGDFTGYGGGLCSFSNLEDISGTVEFTVNGDILTGTYISPDSTGTFNLTYDLQVETPLALADLEGTWVVAEGEGDFSEITISANGSFTGTYVPYGCNVSGQISIIDPELSITNITVTKSDCDAAFMNDTYTGLGVLENQNMFTIIVSGSMGGADFGLFTRMP